MLPILNQSLWRDEAFSVLLSEKNPLEIIRLTMLDTSPPLYYLLLHYWILLFGNTEVSIRGLSFLFHLLLVTAVFFIARHFIRSTLVQVLITTAVLINPFLLQYAFEARCYTMFAFLTLLALYFILRKWYLSAGVVLSLGILTHNFGMFNLIAVAAWYFYEHRARLKERRDEMINLFAPPFFVTLLWGGIIFRQWTKVASGFWIQQATNSIFIHSFEKYVQGDLSYAVQPMVYTITLVLTLFAFSYWIARHAKETKGDGLLLLSFVAIIPTIITYVISALFTPIYHERYLIATAPLLIFLIGYSLVRLFETHISLRHLLTAFIGIYFIVLIQASEQVVATSTKPAINYAVNQVLSKSQQGDVIIPEQTINFLETKYYVEQSGKNIPVYAYAPDGKIPFYIGAVLFEPQEIITQMPTGKRVWQITPDGGYKLIQL